MRNGVEKIIFQALNNLSDEIPELKTVNFKTQLILDSLALVNLVADLEELLSEEFNKEIVLADEKMMSARNSPFKDVESLTDYIIKKLQEQE
ncbi:hypothetical protein BXA15_07470 [Campylobacter lari]|uniref:hypothetical protein n=1 Tax=Campylobacter lari TaxID=201 RepID=UPI00126D7AE6|nr:hypothetical protein [Campylobacter lari]EAI2145555.1 hypothetical protein [Campylobacter lari]EAI3897712.1 hypothetical protein [Campylobacter lari]EAJ5697293.1 hypothetical protein [Campylobacter lari]EAJ5709779.1 hypothetical protein [Campylobacter lari]EHC7930286.1 hypothetical protein [Campylobacter lari]